MILVSIFIGTLILLHPSSAFAWGPTAHMVFANEVLSNLNLLPPLLQQILSLYPEDYLYGNLAADITLGKKYIEYEHHCHNWRVGFEILKKSTSEMLKAFSYGYLTHLAADAVSHNYFVPLKTVESYKGSMLHRHTYWELRFDAAIAEKNILKNAMKITKERYHKECDKHLDKIIHHTLFTFKTNRRIFHGLMALQNLQGYQRTMIRAHGNPKALLTKTDIEEFIYLTMISIYDFLQKGAEASICKLDPSGETNLKRSRRLRRDLRKLSKQKNSGALCEDKINEYRKSLRAQFGPTILKS